MPHHNPPAPAPPIPYITLRQGESDASEQALALRPHRKGMELCYTDEHDTDRDGHGILLARTPQSLDSDGWPTGTPRWKYVHPDRQRKCMTTLTCHVCKGPASNTERGWLFIDVVADRDRRKPGWPERRLTHQPPVCLPHARTAIGLCPYLQREGYVALRVKAPRLYGVFGTPYQLGTGFNLQPARVHKRDTGRPEAVIPFQHPQRHLFLGAQYAMEMNHVTLINLEEELVAATKHVQTGPVS